MTNNSIIPKLIFNIRNKCENSALQRTTILYPIFHDQSLQGEPRYHGNRYYERENSLIFVHCDRYSHYLGLKKVMKSTTVRLVRTAGSNTSPTLINVFLGLNDVTVLGGVFIITQN